jgi:hypothetical protein
MLKAKYEFMLIIQNEINLHFLITLCRDEKEF